MSTKRDGVKVMILETGQEFNSIQSCADYLGVHVNWIKNILNDANPHKVCHGYHIVRIGKQLPDYDLTKHDYRSRPGIRVMIVETGEIFQSITDAAKTYNISPSQLGAVCNHTEGCKTAGKLHWEFVNH